MILNNWISTESFTSPSSLHRTMVRLDQWYKYTLIFMIHQMNKFEYDGIDSLWRQTANSSSGVLLADGFFSCCMSTGHASYLQFTIPLMSRHLLAELHSEHLYYQIYRDIISGMITITTAYTTTEIYILYSTGSPLTIILILPRTKIFYSLIVRDWNKKICGKTVKYIRWTIFQ